jgi:RimJ/RimL family protein N-acetyltransferase
MSATLPQAPRRPTAYRVATARLALRCFAPSDAPVLKASIDESRAHLAPFMPWARVEQSLEETYALCRRFRGLFDLDQDHHFIVFDSAETSVLGGAGLHPRVGPGALEIGYWIHGAHLRRGLATEVTAGLTRVGFEILGLDRIEIHVNVANTASAGVPRKLGYVYEGVARGRRIAPEREPEDLTIWTLLASEYPRTASAGAPIEAYDAAGRRLL